MHPFGVNSLTSEVSYLLEEPLPLIHIQKKEKLVVQNQVLILKLTCLSLDSKVICVYMQITTCVCALGTRVCICTQRVFTYIYIYTYKIFWSKYTCVHIRMYLIHSHVYLQLCLIFISSGYAFFSHFRQYYIYNKLHNTYRDNKPHKLSDLHNCSVFSFLDI